MKKSGLVMLLCLLLMGCNTQNIENTEELIETNKLLNMREVLYEISEEAAFETTFVVDKEYLVEKFECDLAESVEVMGLFGSALDTNRVLLFKVENKTDKAAVLTYLSSLQDLIQASYPEGLTAEKSVIDQAYILDKGSYILFITGAEAQKGRTYFDDLN